MPVNLSIKNAPDEVVAKLKARAARNHRSLQGELMAIVTEAAEKEVPATLGEIRARVQELGAQPDTESSVELIRRMRDERTEHILGLLDRR